MAQEGEVPLTAARPRRQRREIVHVRGQTPAELDHKMVRGGRHRGDCRLLGQFRVLRLMDLPGDSDRRHRKGCQVVGAVVLVVDEGGGHRVLRQGLRLVRKVSWTSNLEWRSLLVTDSLTTSKMALFWKNFFESRMFGSRRQFFRHENSYFGCSKEGTFVTVAQRWKPEKVR